MDAYLQGNDLEDLQRDTRLIANDMNTVLKTTKLWKVINTKRLNKTHLRCLLKKSYQEDITDINKVLENLEPDQRSKIVSAFMALETEHSFRGPLPAPEDFKAYGEVIPDAPERILCLMEQQVEHRIGTEEVSLQVD